ncbi:hypothetical protein [Rubritalea marina]|uniref:hypothetical protein n=1 Tax=Rubritalea marina TaxID=361055 RepID=UPI0003811DAC|nr:hypothetical protein [Rubritalea marina]
MRSIDDHQIQQSLVISNLTKSITNAPIQKIKWNDAINRIESHNLEYLKSKDQVEHTLKSQNRTWWTLAPEIFTFVNISKSLTEISDLTTDDISFSIVGNITIPNPFQFYAQLYADKLSMIAAEWGQEVTRRDFHVRLYSLYIEQQKLNTDEKEFNRLLKQVNQSVHDNFSDRSNQLKRKQLELTTRKEQFRVRLNNLFTTPGGNWKLVGPTPNISYARKVHNLSLNTGYGKLGMMLQTLQIESNVLALWNVKVSRWPQLSIGLSNPPLVNSSSGLDESFDPQQTKLFSGATHGIKLNDPLSTERLKKAEVRAAYIRKELMLKAETDASRLYLIKKRYKYLIEEEKILRAKYQNLERNLHKTSSANLVNTYLKQQSDLKQSLKNNSLQQTQFDLQLWVWDEAYWKKY